MRKIAILTDSACDIPPELEKQYDIDILPFVITLDGVSYVERRDFGFDEFYQMLRAAQGVPSTAQVTAIQFCEQYCKYVDEGYTDVVHVTINSTGSGTYDAAVLAQNMLREERPDHKLNIHLIDSHTYSYVYGAPVVQAARRLRNGAEVGYVCAELEAAFARQEIVLSAFSLKQMKKSGRISAAAAFAGELLGLKPIITIIDGVTKTASKVRGDNAVMPAIVAHAQKNMEPGSEYIVGTTDKDNGKMLASLCKKAFGYPPKRVFLLGAAVATNTGPNAVAMVYRGKPRR